MAEPRAEVGQGVHKTKASSWVTVALIVVAVIVLGFAMPLESVPLFIVGGVVLLVGLITGAVGKIMEDVH